jgi:hypothetical protein
MPTAALRQPWQQAFAAGIAAIIPVALAVGLAWRAAASSSAAG